MTGSMIIRSLTLVRSDHHDNGVYRIQHVQSHRSHHADDDNLHHRGDEGRAHRHDGLGDCFLHRYQYIQPDLRRPSPKLVSKLSFAWRLVIDESTNICCSRIAFTFYSTKHGLLSARNIRR